MASAFRNRLLKLARFTETQSDERGGWLAAILTLFVFMAISNGMFALMEYVVVRCSYGSAAWAAGLRILDNKGNLSNGDVLTGWACCSVSRNFLFECAYSAFCLFVISVYGLSPAWQKMELKGSNTHMHWTRR